MSTAIKSLGAGNPDRAPARRGDGRGYARWSEVDRRGRSSSPRARDRPSAPTQRPRPGSIASRPCVSSSARLHSRGRQPVVAAVPAGALRRPDRESGTVAGACRAAFLVGTGLFRQSAREEKPEAQLGWLTRRRKNCAAQSKRSPPTGTRNTTSSWSPARIRAPQAAQDPSQPVDAAAPPAAQARHQACTTRGVSAAAGDR